MYLGVTFKPLKVLAVSVNQSLNGILLGRPHSLQITGDNASIASVKYLVGVIKPTDHIRTVIYRPAATY